MLRRQINAMWIVLLLNTMLNAADFSWQQVPAKVLPEGDLQWQPQAFNYSPGNNIRYIDFENGKDSNDGSKDAPWKHHPWDPKADGNAKAATNIDTYVFKGGVTYRGTLLANASGEPGNPVRLTRDPAWGEGEAVISGAETVSGWQQGANHPKIPEADKVWQAEIDFAPRTLWSVEGGKISRIPLARTPNWQLSDPDDIKSEWFHWDMKGKKHFGHRDGNFHKAFDSVNINQPEDYYKGAYVWSEWGWVMGTPYPTPVEKVNLEEKSLSFRGQWGGPSGQIIKHCRYYLEDKPHYLDDPNGEFWFDKKGNGGTLYLRLPEGKNPNQLQIEAGKRIHVIESENMNHIHISGLSFRFTNVYWSLDAGPWVHKDVDPACIRLLGSGKDITVRNCLFEHVHNPIRMKAVDVDDVIDQLIISDNVIRYTDHSAIQLMDGGGWGKTDEHIGRLLDTKVLRNQLYMVGMRPSRFGQGHAIEIECAETLEVAGNFLDRCYASGIHVFGAKRSALAADRPLSRILIHHNKVTNSMLNNNDWGGIETWQGGPAYVFNNISGNPGGYWHWKHKNHPDEPNNARFGHAYYLDGAFKNYYFNNIAWGKSKDPLSRLGNTSAFQEIHSYQNTFSNNTAYNFVVGSRRQSPHAGRNKYLANIWDGIGHRVFRHADPAKSIEEANAADAGKQKEHFAYETNAYSENIFYDVGQYAVFEASGRWHKSLDEFKQALAESKTMLSDVGIEANSNPLRDPANHDFRLADNSPAIGRGAKVFMPWALHANVGEWHFYPAGNDPRRIIDEHWYMAPYYTDRTGYHDHPMFPLTGVNITAENYVTGPLEDWTKGALKLNGQDQYAVIKNVKFTFKEDEIRPPFERETVNWLKITGLPDALTPQKPTSFQIELVGVPDGGFIQTDLHWRRKTGSGGGMNTSAGRHKIKGSGSYEFTITPADKPEIDYFELIVFVTADGTWNGRTHLTRQKLLANSKLPGEARRLRSPAIEKENFLIEAYLQAENTNAVIMEKTDTKNGYSLTLDTDGHAAFNVKAGGRDFTVRSPQPLNDGDWHHLIAEADRAQQKLTLYLDGRQIASAPGPDAASLANPSDLFVGGTPDGRCLDGTLDFLRISQGTIADAKTTLEELYAWQFNGPFLRDFTGREPKGRRDAGAIGLQ